MTGHRTARPRSSVSWLAGTHAFGSSRLAEASAPRQLHWHYLWLVACPIWTGALIGPNCRVASEAFFGIIQNSFCTESGDPPEMPSDTAPMVSVYVQYQA